MHCSILVSWDEGVKKDHRKRLNASVGRGCTAVAQSPSALWWKEWRLHGNSCRVMDLQRFEHTDVEYTGTALVVLSDSVFLLT